MFVLLRLPGPTFHNAQQTLSPEPFLIRPSITVPKLNLTEPIHILRVGHIDTLPRVIGRSDRVVGITIEPEPRIVVKAIMNHEIGPPRCAARTTDHTFVRIESAADSPIRV